MTLTLDVGIFEKWNWKCNYKKILEWVWWYNV